MDVQPLDAKRYQQQILERLREKRKQKIFHSNKPPREMHERAEQREKRKSVARGKIEKLVEEQVDLGLLKEAIETEPQLLAISKDELDSICAELLSGINAKDLRSIEHNEHLYDSTLFLFIARLTTYTFYVLRSVLAKAAEPSVSIDKKLMADENTTARTSIVTEVTGGAEIVSVNAKKGIDFPLKIINKMPSYFYCLLLLNLQLFHSSENNENDMQQLIKSVSISGASSADIQNLLMFATEDQVQTVTPKILFSTTNFEEKLKNFHAQLCFPTDVSSTIMMIPCHLIA